MPAVLEENCFQKQESETRDSGSVSQPCPALNLDSASAGGCPHVLLWVRLLLRRPTVLGSSRDYCRRIHSQFGAWATGKLQTIWVKMVGKLQCLGLSHQPLHFYFLAFFFISFPSLHRHKITSGAEEQYASLARFSPPVCDVFCKQTCKLIQNLTNLR